MFDDPSEFANTQFDIVKTRKENEHLNELNSQLSKS